MRKILISCIVFLIAFSLFLSSSESGFAKTEIIWQNFSNGIRDKNTNFILIDLNTIYIGTDKGIYISKDEGKYYKKVLNISGKNSEVNFLVKDQNNSSAIYAATENGLYRSNNEGKSWKNIFKGRNSLQRNCNAVLADQNKIYLATKEGFFFSFDGAKTWSKLSGELGSIEIVSFALEEDNIYLATAQGIYSLTLDLKDQNKLYSTSTQEANDSNEENNNTNSDETVGLSRVNDIKVDVNRVYFGSDKGLFVSNDSGKTWQRFNLEGLLSKNIKVILLDSKTNQIFVGTDKGIFEFSQNRWYQLYKGMITNKINHLAADSTSNLWAATERGVFKGSPQNATYAIKPDEIEEFFVAFRGEPSIQEIQNEAIKYAEVQPEKIKSWRKAAARSAWLPKVSMGVDRDENLTISDSVWGSYTSGGQDYVGPDDKTFYDNFNWDVSLAWDLGELVWNSDQTSIDSRSKLMVELREDILDEVTRLYFERRRLQTELLISPPEEANDRLDKVLRLEELTASIDALTGGYLSKVLGERIDSASLSGTNISF